MGISMPQAVAIDALILFLLLPWSHSSGETVRTVKGEKVLDIGVILNFDSLVGKEAWAAIQIASQDFNATPRGYKLELHHENSGGKPLQAVSSAKKLIKKRVKVIIGLETWKVAELVAQLGNRFQVPVISLARNNLGTMIPGLIQMGSNKSEQVRCMVDVVWFYNRNRVSTIYEDIYDDDYSLSLYLSKELHNIGSEIEEQVVLPPYSLLSDPKSVVKQKLSVFEGRLSSVFFVLDLSLPMARRLLKEAKTMGLFEGDSIWILSESVLNILDSVNSKVTSSMTGAIGITTDVPRKSKYYLDFSRKFDKKFNHMARDFSPGIHALRAYDSITIVTKAIDGASGDTMITPKLLVKKMLQSKFDGLSGQVAFKEGQISSPRKPKIISISDKKKSYEELNIQSIENALSARNAAVPELRYVIKESYAGGRAIACSDEQQRNSSVMKIGVPHQTPLDKFVKEDNDTGGSLTEYTGFCIDVFDSILKILSEETFPPYCFVTHNGSYDELVENVHNETYFAAVGDITILANRSKIVSFTQPFMESSLVMIAVAEQDSKTWILVRPFSTKMWIAAGFQLIVVMLTVWCLESPANKAFQGSWSDQMEATVWFTCSSLFFAHREQIQRNLTRIVVVVWFFVALVLTQSYTANLTSMLTVQKLKQSKITLDWLKQNNATVGCDKTTFLYNFLVTTQKFGPLMIDGITEYADIRKKLENKSIKAMFVEYPYSRAFFSHYCLNFTVTYLPYRFGGFGFAFHKISSWTDKFSEAILELSENGELKNMTDRAFPDECSKANVDTTTSSDSETQSLGIESFWVLFAISLSISLLCLLLSCFFPVRNGNNGRAADDAGERLNRAPEHIQDQAHEMLTLHDHRI